jgi:formyltetrahydrofolate deformylase
VNVCLNASNELRLDSISMRIKKRLFCASRWWWKVAIEKATKTADMAKMMNTVDSFNPDVIVLARYMQIIPKSMCEKYQGKIINIHHSFLPSFVGANPYQRAADRGVKLIGATCRYITNELDEGPIIEQDVLRVDHSDNAEEMQKMGQDITNYSTNMWKNATNTLKISIVTHVYF